ncbi:HesA/MoeB/ThiF family protein [Pseudoxanthobacter soli]|nr:molybdopterin-synthase adenylyltransferase MoeB [Pseudoxanthobacter soli]
MEQQGEPQPVFAGDEIARYARQLVLPEVGGPGQQRLKAARVLVVGAGGLGSPLALYLAAAGIGTVGVVDDDTVAVSNLQRQVIHGTADIGRPKVDSAADAIGRLNPHVTVERHALRLDADNAEALVAAYDVVADGSDNFATRYLLADSCALLRRPLVSAALGRFDGTLTTLMPWTTRDDGTSNPTYRDLFPSPPAEGTIPNCEEAGVLGTVAGLMGTLQATEVVRVLLGIGRPLVGRLLIVDALSMRFETIEY